MNNKTTTQSATNVGEQQTGSYLQLLLHRASEKNNGAIAKNLKRHASWPKECSARVEYNQLNESESQSVIHPEQENGMDVLYNSATIPFTAEDEEEVWMEAQYFQDYTRSEEVYPKTMQDKSLEWVGNEFFGLVRQGKKLITGGLIPLRE